MTDIDEDLYPRQRYELNPRLNWGQSAAVVFLALPIIAALSGIGFFLVAFVGYPIALLGGPYAVFVVAYTVVKSVKSRSEKMVVNHAAMRFNTSSQQITLLLNISLVIIAIIGLLSFLIPSFSDAVVVIFLLVPAAIISIVANRNVIYGDVAKTERWAMRNHRGNWKFFIFARALSWFVWLLYGITGTVAAVYYLTDMASF
jgi:hypothetical protein